MTGEQQHVDLMALGRSLGQLTAAVEANTESTDQLREAQVKQLARLEVVERGMAEITTTRKNLGLLWAGFVFLGGGIVTKLGGWFWDHWKP